MNDRQKDINLTLLNSGLLIFARYGINGVTTRDLAKAANVNIATIAYHFGGKDDYYLAVIDYLITQKLTPLFNLLRDTQIQIAQKNISSAQLEILLKNFIYRLALQFLCNLEAQFAARLLIRECIHPTIAREKLFKLFKDPLYNICSILIDKTYKNKGKIANQLIDTHAILGQIIFIAIAEKSIYSNSNNNIDNKLAKSIAKQLTLNIFNQINS